MAITTLNGLSAQQLRKAATLAEKMEALNKQLANIVIPSATTPKGRPKRKGQMSAAGRARIAAAQRKRWAKQKKVTKETS
jgi:hypothetical protein